MSWGLTLGSIRHSRRRSAIRIENSIVINAQFRISQSPILAVQPRPIILLSTPTREGVPGRFRVGIDDFAMFRMSFDICEIIPVSVDCSALKWDGAERTVSL